MQHRTRPECQKLQVEGQRDPGGKRCVQNRAALFCPCWPCVLLAVPGEPGRDESRTLSHPHCLGANELLCTSSECFRWASTAGSRFPASHPPLPGPGTWTCRPPLAFCKPGLSSSLVLAVSYACYPVYGRRDGGGASETKSRRWLAHDSMPRLAHVNWHRRAFSNEGLTPLGRGQRLSSSPSSVFRPLSISSPRWRRRRPNPSDTRDSAIQYGGDRRGRGGGRLACPCCPGLPCRAALRACRSPAPRDPRTMPPKNAMRPARQSWDGKREREGASSVLGAQPHHPPRTISTHKDTRMPVPVYASFVERVPAGRRVTGCRLRLGTSTIGQPPCHRPLLANNKGERDCIPLAGPNRPLRPNPAQPCPALPAEPAYLASLAVRCSLRQAISDGRCCHPIA